MNESSSDDEDGDVDDAGDDDDDAGDDDAGGNADNDEGGGPSERGHEGSNPPTRNAKNSPISGIHQAEARGEGSSGRKRPKTRA